MPSALPSHSSAAWERTREQGVFASDYSEAPASNPNSGAVQAVVGKGLSLKLVPCAILKIRASLLTDVGLKRLWRVLGFPCLNIENSYAAYGGIVGDRAASML